MFDENGLFIGMLPPECIRECSHAGPCDTDVTSWREKLQFTVPRAQAEKYLREVGYTDCASVDDVELAERVLWAACCNIAECGEWIGLVN